MRRSNAAADGEVRNVLERLADERLHQHAPRIRLADAAGAQVEQRVLIQLAGGGAMAAFHVVGEDLEFRLGVDLRAVRQQDILLS